MMKRLLFAQGAALLLAASAAFFACGGSEDSSDPKVRYCQQLCDCNKCSDDERTSCKDDITNRLYDARDENCEDDFNTYVTCLVNDATCSGGEYDVETCSAEELDLSECIKPPPKPTCKTTKDGICDEPEGTGTCPEGSDKDDCDVKTCPTANDGVCDESDGTCPPGTDAADCSTCPYANDGYCDEPEGSGYCEEGSDPLDCPTQACVTCSQYVNNPKGELCAKSASLYNNLYNCACVGGSCASSCDSGLDMCAGYAAGSACLTCTQTYCSSQQQACLLDTGK
jgi:hypothetical protein